MKKFLLGLFAGVLIAALPISFAYVYPGEPVDFSDVNEDDWFYYYVGDLNLAGYADGYSDGTFRPNDSITRAEVSKLVWLLDDSINDNIYSISSLSDEVEELEAKLATLDLPGVCFYDDAWYSVEDSVEIEECITGVCLTKTCTCQEDGEFDDCTALSAI